MALGPILVSLLDSSLSSGQESNFLTNLLGSRLSAFALSLGLDVSHYSRSEVLGQLWWILLVLAAVKFIVSSAQWLIWEYVGENSAYELRKSLMTSFLDSNFERSDLSQEPSRKSLSESMSTLVGTDIKMYRDFLVRYYGGVPRELLTSIVLIVSLVLISPKMSFLMFIVILPFVLVLSKFGRRIRERSESALRNFDLLSEAVQKRLLGIETIKHLKMEQDEFSRISKINLDSERTFLKAARVKARVSPAIEFGGGIAVCAVLYFMLHTIFGGDASPAEQMSFLASAGLLSQSAGHLSKHFSSLKEVASSKSRIVEFLDLTKNSPRINTWIQHRRYPDLSVSALKLNDIVFSIPRQNGLEKKLVNVQVNGGEIAVIAGKSGAGKSTLMSILLGLRAPESGNIEYQIPEKISGGRPLVVYVSQDLHNMPMSVAQYVSYPLATYDRQLFQAAVQSVNLEAWVKSLPLGPESQLAFNDSNLSGGQMQRLQLARIFYHRPFYVFLDEATSALDLENEDLFLKNLQRFAHNDKAVVMMIAHRDASIAIADKKIEL